MTTHGLQSLEPLTRLRRTCLIGTRMHPTSLSALTALPAPFLGECGGRKWVHTGTCSARSGRCVQMSTPMSTPHVRLATAINGGCWGCRGNRGPALSRNRRRSWNGPLRQNSSPTPTWPTAAVVRTSYCGLRVGGSNGVSRWSRSQARSSTPFQTLLLAAHRT